MMEYRIYAGTYAGADENGIFRYRMDGNSQILERQLALPGISNPSYLALSQNGTMMYAVTVSYTHLDVYKRQAHKRTFLPG